MTRFNWALRCACGIGCLLHMSCASSSDIPPGALVSPFIDFYSETHSSLRLVTYNIETATPISSPGFNCTKKGGCSIGNGCVHVPSQSYFINVQYHDDMKEYIFQYKLNSNNKPIPHAQCELDQPILNLWTDGSADTQILYGWVFDQSTSVSTIMKFNMSSDDSTTQCSQSKMWNVAADFRIPAYNNIAYDDKNGILYAFDDCQLMVGFDIHSGKILSNASYHMPLVDPSQMWGDDVLLTGGFVCAGPNRTTRCVVGLDPLNPPKPGDMGCPECREYNLAPSANLFASSAASNTFLFSTLPTSAAEFINVLDVSSSTIVFTSPAMTKQCAPGAVECLNTMWQFIDPISA